MALPDPSNYQSPVTVEARLKPPSVIVTFTGPDGKPFRLILPLAQAREFHALIGQAIKMALAGDN